MNTMIRHPSSRLPTNRQHGAALIIALIILLVLTVMGVSGLRHAGLEGNMAYNTQVKSATFQAAETALGGVALNQGTVLNDAVNAGTAGSVNSDYSALTNPPGATQHVTANVNTAYVGWLRAPGYSLKESTGFAQFNFELTATGAMVNASAESRHLQGAAKVGPMAGALW